MFSLNSANLVAMNFSLKGFEPAASLVGDQDTTVIQQ